MSLDPSVAGLAILLGYGFARDMGREATEDEAGVMLRHLKEMVQRCGSNCTNEDVQAMWLGALAEIAAASASKGVPS